MLKPHRYYRTLQIIAGIILLTLTLFAFSVQQRRNTISADADFLPVFQDTGNYYIVTGGTGTRGVPLTNDWTGEGDIELAIPDTATIVKARLIWTGRSNSFDVDGVTLSIDGAPPIVFTPDIQYEQFPWCCPNASGRQIHESTEITAQIQPGTHTYTVSDHEHGLSPNTNNLNYGVGIWVVYEYTPPNISNPLQRETIIYQGQDSFFRTWNPPRGPHTEVRCADITPAAVERRADVTHLVSGVDTWDTITNGTRLRSVAFWSKTGVGPKPPEDEHDPLGDKTPTLALPVHSGDGYDPGGQYPLQSYAGLEWDNFDMDQLIVPANHEWVCFQIESGDHANLAGLMNAGLEASGMWNLFALSLYDPTLAIDLLSFEATAVSNQTVRLSWQTATETNNFGFNIYRNSSNDFATATKIHFEPASLANQSGASYQYDDLGLSFGNYYYWLEDIDTSNDETSLHGPVHVEVARFKNEFLPLILKP